MTRFLVFVSIAAMMTACSGKSTTLTPTAPAPIPDGGFVPAPSPGTFTLAGAVIEMTDEGPVPVAGARVEIADTNQAVDTDTDGFFSLGDLSAGYASISVTKDGYRVWSSGMDLDGDAHMDITLEREE